MDAVELQAVRGTIRHEARSNAVRTTKGTLVLFAIFVGAYALDCLLRGELIRYYGDTSVIALGCGAFALAVLVPQLFWLRLRTLGDLDRAPVYRTTGPIDLRGGLHMRLRGNRGYSGHEMRLLHGFHDPIDPEFVWRMDFVRTQRGRDLFYILRAQAVRAAAPGERDALVKYLWDTRVYVDTSSD